MPAVRARGVELAWTERGTGEVALLLHETATTGAVWDRVVEELGGVRALALDRRGWGRSTTPDGYLRTTIEEQSEDAAAVLESAGSDRAVVCGAGLGGVIALDLAIRRAGLVAGAVLIEPPVLGLLPGGADLLADDRRQLERVVAEEGLPGVVELYLSGGLGALGPGVERLGGEATAPARAAPRTLVAEIGAATTWSMPTARLREASPPCAIVISAGTPEPIREAGEALQARLPRAELCELPGRGPAHADAPKAVAERISAAAAGSLA